MNSVLHCSVCEHPIGVYEPLIVLSGYEVRRTSLAAEPTAADDADAVVHRSCVRALDVTPASPHASASPQ